MRILTIIVSYNFTRWMTRSVGSLLASTQPTDILVVDNASADDTVARLRAEYPGVEVIENHANLGFGAANNIGLRLAVERGYEAVMLLNQDAWIAADTLGCLVRTSLSHPEYAVLSPVHLTGSGEAVEHGFSVYTGLTALGEQPGEELVDAPFIDAAIWYMPVRAIRAVGLFAPVFAHYGEDRDLCNRMLYHGWRIGWLPRVYGCHDREWRVPTRASRFRAERTYHLSEYTNPRLSLTRALLLGPAAVVKKAIRSLLRLHPRDAATYLSIALWLAGKSREVIQTRKQAKKGAL